MKQVFVDTNILIDLLAERPPFSKFAIELFNRAEKNNVKLFTSSHSIATTHYLLKKYVDEATLRVTLFNLLDFIAIIPIDLSIIKRSLQSKHKDFEDAIQIFAANTIDNLDFIVTRNLKDFKNAGTPVLPPDELLNYL
ncbi:MAG TPA: PIN domain-containing protein [Mucilaginibacter sp.]|jgi:predicted nucleic acid-binding protein|nr:PIN domain-containing protein [Mucilaginibacter sp.]